MFCTKCGGEVPDDAPFCLQCGTQLQTAAPVSTAPQAQEMESQAMTSLVLGILGLFFSIFASIPAIILGHSSYKEIKKSEGRLSGEDIALAGLILGYIGTALLPIILLVAIPRLMHSKIVVNESHTVKTLNRLNDMQARYSTIYREAGYAPDLATLGPGTLICQSSEGTQKNACLIDEELGCPGGTSGQWCTVNQYKYSIAGIKPDGSGKVTDYVITATPISSDSGKKNYCSTKDIVVRFQEGPPLSAPVASVEECKKWSNKW